MFIGREREIQELNTLYESQKFEMAVVYGRRYVGKTSIISEFIKDKEAIYFAGFETNEKMNLNNLCRCIVAYKPEIEEYITFSNYEMALKYIFNIAKEKRVVFVIDNYSCVDKSVKGFNAMLKSLIDKYKAESKLFLIICDSSISYVENNITDSKSPLRKCISASYKVQPLGFVESCDYLEDYSMVDKAVAYGITGGVPQYLRLIDDDLSIDANIKRLYLNSSSVLREELENALRQEVREPGVYNAIITAVATGASKLSQIAEAVGESTSACAIYIKNLIAFGIVKKEMPLGDTSSRKTIYKMADNALYFWYRFIPDNMSLISVGKTDVVYNRIKADIADYMGDVFRDICKQFIERLLAEGKIPVKFTHIGRWWGMDVATKEKQEIDIVATDNKDGILFCECKWTDERVSTEVLEKLIQKSEVFEYKKKYYYIFSKNGFTKECAEKAKRMSNVVLITYKG
ncbi:MAG: ATP-binding protein [Lachnospira sp.]|nr:ATP-binding protein [Lachnospira sp.]